MARQYWLMKSEPNAYAFSDLQREGTTGWDGVRNYQARNFMRDLMKVGDGVLFYHSNTEPVGIAGEAKIVRAGYPDDTAWDPNDKHYDPKSNPVRPIWFRVDVQFVRACRAVITLDRLRAIFALRNMIVLKLGNRLSVSPVTEKEFTTILKFPEWL